ncbi:unnamed protein product, partial [marine sediment metagenome]
MGGNNRLKYIDEYRNKEMAQWTLQEIKNISKKRV